MTRAVRVLHIASGDLWAGAEVQAVTLMSHLKRIPQTEVAAVLMNEGMMAEKLRSAGIGVYVTDERKLGALRILLSLRKLLNSWRPHIIHTHRAKETILGCLGNLTSWNAPSVRTVHGGTEPLTVAGWPSVRHELIACADRWCGRMLQQRIIAVTDELAGKLGEEYPAHKIVVIENGIDVETVRLERGTADFRAREPNATHIGIAGRLVDVKRVDLFVEAAALLWREFPERSWRFHVFGDGPKRQSLQELSTRLGLNDKVIFHGHRQDIESCVSGLDALLICSDHEGMPMISLEAAALGVPTVGHAVGGLVEVVPEEFLVFQHDAPGYKDGVLRALRADARSITARRSADIIARFSATRNADRIRKMYEEVLAQKNDRSKEARGAD